VSKAALLAMASSSSSVPETNVYLKNLNFKYLKSGLNHLLDSL
jgi:hypothetical protein